MFKIYHSGEYSFHWYRDNRIDIFARTSIECFNYVRFDDYVTQLESVVANDR